MSHGSVIRWLQDNEIRMTSVDIDSSESKTFMYTKLPGFYRQNVPMNTNCAPDRDAILPCPISPRQPFGTGKPPVPNSSTLMRSCVTPLLFNASDMTSMNLDGPQT